MDWLLVLIFNVGHSREQGLVRDTAYCINTNRIADYKGTKSVPAVRVGDL